MRKAALLLVALLLPAVAGGQEWRGPAALEVQVEDAKGRNLAGAEVLLVYLSPEGGGSLPSVLTDSNGKANIGGLAAGRWTAEVRHAGQMSFRAELTLSADSKPVVQSASHLMAPGATSTMKVKFARGRGGMSAPSAPAAPAPAPPEAKAPVKELPPPAPVVPAPAPAPAAPAPKAPVKEVPPPASVAPSPAPVPAPPAAKAPVKELPPPSAATPAPAPVAASAPEKAPAKEVAPVAPVAPVVQPAPVPAPPSAVAPPVVASAAVTPPPPAPVPSAPAPPAVAPAPAASAAPSRTRLCVECPAGESAAWGESAIAGGATAGCPADLQSRLKSVDLTAVGALSGELEAAGLGCRVIAVEIPAGARFTGFRYEAQSAGVSADCLPGRGCPAGGCSFPGEPVLRVEGNRTTLLVAFESTAPELRRAVVAGYSTYNKR